MILYISGPMSGIADFNYPAFNEMAEWLEDNGHDVISPVDIGNASWTWEDNMRVCLSFLTQADAIVVLPNWNKSKGATTEVMVGLALGMTIYQVYDSQLYVVNAREMINDEILNRIMGEKQ